MPAEAVTENGRSNPATQRVFVLDKHGRPLQPCHPARARELLTKGRARVHRHTPFVIRLIDRTVEDSVVAGVEVGVDPGSKATGLAVFTVTDSVDTTTGEVATARQGIWLGELIHRGLVIKKAMHARAALRRGRRSRNLRYRAPRFNNRTRQANRADSGVWLPPSLNHRLDTTLSWLDRLSRWAPVTAVHVERVRFDTQKMLNPDIAGTEYQRGSLFEYEVREYIFEKWGRQCIYCDTTKGPFNLDHLLAKARGGSNRASNLGPACIGCNTDKGSQLIEDYLAHDPKRLARINAKRQKPLSDAAAVNATRWAIFRMVEALGNRRGFTVHASTGGRTKWNRHNTGTPKTHALDALCVGVLDAVAGYPATTNEIKCTGRGSYARTRSDKYGFPRLRLTRTKQHFGFATGDLVKAFVPTGAKAGTHIGRVAVRKTGSFNITTPSGVVQGISHRHIKNIQRADGYTHTTRKEVAA